MAFLPPRAVSVALLAAVVAASSNVTFVRRHRDSGNSGTPPPKSNATLVAAELAAHPDGFGEVASSDVRYRENNAEGGGSIGEVDRGDEDEQPEKTRTDSIELGSFADVSFQMTNVTEMRKGMETFQNFVKKGIAKKSVKSAVKKYEKMNTCNALEALQKCDKCEGTGCMKTDCIDPMVQAAKELAKHSSRAAEEVKVDTKKVDEGTARVQKDMGKNAPAQKEPADKAVQKAADAEEKKEEAGGEASESNLEKEEAKLEEKYPKSKDQKKIMAAQKNAVVKLTELKIMTKAKTEKIGDEDLKAKMKAANEEVKKYKEQIDESVRKINETTCSDKKKKDVCDAIKSLKKVAKRDAKNVVCKRNRFGKPDPRGKEDPNGYKYKNHIKKYKSSLFDSSDEDRIIANESSMGHASDHFEEECEMSTALSGHANALREHDSNLSSMYESFKRKIATRLADAEGIGMFKEIVDDSDSLLAAHLLVNKPTATNYDAAAFVAGVRHAAAELHCLFSFEEPDCLPVSADLHRMNLEAQRRATPNALIEYQGDNDPKKNDDETDCEDKKVFTTKKARWGCKFKQYGKKWIILFLLGLFFYGLCIVAFFFPLCIVGFIMFFVEVFFFVAMVIAGIMYLLSDV